MKVEIDKGLDSGCSILDTRYWMLDKSNEKTLIFVCGFNLVKMRA